MATLVQPLEWQRYGAMELMRASIYEVIINSE
jgi:hypothetical protein